MIRATHTIAIVGGGSVATSFLYQFLDSLTAPAAGLTILLFEPGDQIGPGEAYQDDQSSNLLNIPASAMSAIAAERGDFVHWLETRTPAYLQSYEVERIEPTDFYPRPLFGEYLRDVYARAQGRAAELGIRVQHVRTVVSSVRPDPVDPHGRVQVTCEDGANFDVDRVVLCNGNLPSVAFRDLESAEGYFNSPYPARRLTTKIGRRDTVCILGTSLSAIDAMVALQAAGHQGKIVSISRGGRLPAVRSPSNPSLSLRHLVGDHLERLLASKQPDASLGDVYGMLLAMLARAGGAFDSNDVLGEEGDPHHALRQEIDRSLAGPRLWQAVASATNDQVEHVWHVLGPAEKRQFLDVWKGLWMARRATFPMKNARKIYKLFEQEQLIVLDKFQRAERSYGTHRFRVTRGGPNAPAVAFGCDWLINATSFSTTVLQTGVTLVDELIDKGIAQEDPFGGVKLDFETGCLIGRNGNIEERVSLLGSLATGTYFWTASMEINARLAQRQAQRMASEIQYREANAA